LANKQKNRRLPVFCLFYCGGGVVDYRPVAWGGAACKNFFMRKRFYKYCFVLAFMPAASHAARLDISRIKRENEFSVTVGAYYETGLNATATHQTDFKSGQIDTDSFDLSYTPTENLSLVFTTSNNYADAAVGVQYKLIKYDSIKLTAMADYGFAWSHDAVTDNRLGNNNVLAGLRVDGVAGAFQWGASARMQYVWAQARDFYNIKLVAQAMYYFVPDLAVQVEFDFDFLQINLSDVLYDKTLTAGLVYNFTRAVSVNPFVEYHFRTAEYQTDYMSYYDYFQIGVALSAQF